MSFNKKFWVVWNPSAHVPRFMHESYDSAKKEAERLALNHPGAQFVVLESVGMAKRVDVQWVEITPKFEPGDLPPF